VEVVRVDAVKVFVDVVPSRRVAVVWNEVVVTPEAGISDVKYRRGRQHFCVVRIPGEPRCLFLHRRRGRYTRCRSPTVDVIALGLEETGELVARSQLERRLEDEPRGLFEMGFGPDTRVWHSSRRGWRIARGVLLRSVVLKAGKEPQFVPLERTPDLSRAVS